MTEEAAIADFGDIGELTAEILEAYHVRADFDRNKEPEKKNESHKNAVMRAGRKISDSCKKGWEGFLQGLENIGLFVQKWAGRCRTAIHNLFSGKKNTEEKEEKKAAKRNGNLKKNRLLSFGSREHEEKRDKMENKKRITLFSVIGMMCRGCAAAEFYTLPQEKRGYPVWFDTAEQTSVFYKNEQNVYGLANIVTLGIAVYAPADREFLGVLLLNIDLNAFSGAMEGYEEYNDGNTFLIGEDGILMWFNPSISAPAFPRDGLLFQEMKGNGKGISQMNSDGQELLLAYEKIPNTDVFVAHVVDLAVLYAGTYQIRNLCILVLLAVVIACTVISYYVTSSISEPIGQLIKVMQMTGDGKWNERFPNSGKDEITILGDRFNEMADKTDQLIEQVYLSEIRRQEVSISWTNARLDALLMQINPHFLYNTLDIIRWEAMYEANGESPVTQMIEKFSPSPLFHDTKARGPSSGYLPPYPVPEYLPAPTPRNVVKTKICAPSGYGPP